MGWLYVSGPYYRGSSWKLCCLYRLSDALHGLRKRCLVTSKVILSTLAALSHLACLDGWYSADMSVSILLVNRSIQ